MELKTAFSALIARFKEMRQAKGAPPTSGLVPRFLLPGLGEVEIEFTGVSKAA